MKIYSDVNKIYGNNFKMILIIVPFRRFERIKDILHCLL